MVDDGTRAEQDARLAGGGLDWAEVPSGLDDDGRAAWEHLRVTFESWPTRFREGDRAAVAAYCMARSLNDRAAAALLAEGLAVEGRSSADHGRTVKSPHFMIWRDTGAALRAWCRELALTTDSRGRANVQDKPEEASDAGNPFAG